MMLGKNSLFIILSQTFTNGLWFCSTQQETLMETPMAMIPLLSALGLFMFFMDFIIENWD